MENWVSINLGNVCNIKKGEQLNKLALEDTGDYPCVNGGISPSGYTDKWNTEENTITISEGGNSCGYINFIKTNFWSGGHCYSLLGIKIFLDKDYLYYALKGREKLIMDLRVGSGLPNIQQKAIKAFEFIYPKDKAEQSKIAEILSKVDKAISETEAIIAKYNRIKTGLIQDLLTKGIDEKGNIRNEKTHKFKDSLLGRIPKEWKVDNLKNLCNSDITYGIVQAGPNIENGIPYIRTGDMSGDYLSIDNLLRTTPKIAERFERSRVLKGEIVFALRATIGKVLLVPEKLNGANLTQGTARISANENKVKNEFLLYCLRMQYFKTQILENQKGTTFFEISLGHLRNMKVFYPESLDEQNKIIDGLNDIENSINKYKEELYKLKSIKTGLMQDLLSGNKRVTHLIN